MTHDGIRIQLSKVRSFSLQFARKLYSELRKVVSLDSVSIRQYRNADPALSPQCLFTDYRQEDSWYNVVSPRQCLGLGCGSPTRAFAGTCGGERSAEKACVAVLLATLSWMRRARARARESVLARLRAWTETAVCVLLVTMNR